MLNLQMDKLSYCPDSPMLFGSCQDGGAAASLASAQRSELSYPVYYFEISGGHQTTQEEFTNFIFPNNLFQTKYYNDNGNAPNKSYNVIQS